MLPLFGPLLFIIASVVSFPAVNDCVTLIGDPVDVIFNTRRLVCYWNPLCGRYSPHYFTPNRVEIYEDGPGDGTLLASCAVGQDTVVSIRVRIGRNDSRDNCVWSKRLSFGIIVRIGFKSNERYRCVISGREDDVYRHFENTYKATYMATQMKNEGGKKTNITYFTTRDPEYSMKTSSLTIKSSTSSTEKNFYTTRSQGYTAKRTVSTTRNPGTLTQKLFNTSRGPVYQTEHSAYTSVYPRYTTEKHVNTKRGLVVISLKASTTSVPRYSPQTPPYNRSSENSTATLVSTSRGTIYSTVKPVNTTRGSVNSTEKPFYTPRGPVNSTAKPVSTTRGTIYQTGHSAYTSVYPRYTTEKPANTKSGLVVISIKASTTSVPRYSPQTPLYTRSSEYSTTKPVSTSRDPVYSSKRTDYTTRNPVYSTEKPINTTEKQSYTTRGPVYLVEKTMYTTKSSEYSIEKPIYTTKGLLSLTEKPIYTLKGPMSPTEKSIYSTKGQVYSTGKPIFTTRGPEYSTVKPINTTKGLVYSTEKPISTTNALVYSIEKPIETTRTPAYSTEKLIDTTIVKAYLTENPIETTAVPVYSTEKPIDTTNVPVNSTGKPTYATIDLVYSTGNPILTEGDTIFTTPNKESLHCVFLTTNVQDMKHFIVECTVNNCMDLSNATLVSLQITKTLAGKDTPIARIEKARGKAVAFPIKDEQKNVTVSGKLIDGQGGYLMSEWDWQDVYDSGTYGCSLNYRYAQGRLLTMKEVKIQEASAEYLGFIDGLLGDLDPSWIENTIDTYTSEKPDLNPVERDLKSLETYRQNVIDYFFYEPITFGNKRFHLSKEMFRNDVSSDDLCRVIVEGYLAELEDTGEYDLVVKYLKERLSGGAIIGGILDESVGTWKFRRSGRVVPYFQWANGEPSNMDGKEHCLAISTTIDYFMDDTQCVFNGKNYQFVCETDII